VERGAWIWWWLSGGASGGGAGGGHQKLPLLLLRVTRFVTLDRDYLGDFDFCGGLRSWFIMGCRFSTSAF